jgi:hypothetical protein
VLAVECCEPVSASSLLLVCLESILGVPISDAWRASQVLRWGAFIRYPSASATPRMSRSSPMPGDTVSHARSSTPPGSIPAAPRNWLSASVWNIDFLVQEKAKRQGFKGPGPVRSPAGGLDRPRYDDRRDGGRGPGGPGPFRQGGSRFDDRGPQRGPQVSRQPWQGMQCLLV